MFGNYLKIALRNIIKNRLYAVINIFGLAIGLAVFLFGNILSNYEQDHDSMFANKDRIYSLGSFFSPDAGIGVRGQDSVFAGFGAVIRENIPEIEAVARTKRREYLIVDGEKQFYQTIKFADPGLTVIFDLDYLAGGSEALEAPDSIMVSRSFAEKMFGTVEALDKTVTLNRTEQVRIAAVYEDLPANTHFNSSIISSDNLDIVAPMALLTAISGYNPDEDWGNLSMGENTYLLLPKGVDEAWLRQRIDPLYEQHYNEDQKDFITGIDYIPLENINGYIWEMIGIPTYLIIQILGLVVLSVACVNYANLAVAQSLSRAPEVGLRKTLGASQGRLLGQFLIESYVLVTIGLILALVLIEVALPIFNDASGKVMAINYLPLLPWFAVLVFTVGTLSGLYPAVLITKTSPIEALRDGQSKSGQRQWLRAAMVGTQFFFSIILLACVAVMYMQNNKMQESGDIYPRDQIMVLSRTNIQEVRPRQDTLRQELLAIPGVKQASYSSQVPFDQSNSTYSITRVDGDGDNKFSVNRIRIDYSWMKTYGIPFVAGSDFEIGDVEDSDASTINVIINEMTAERLGFNSPQEAVGELFYEGPNEEARQEHRIIGVVQDQNILGFHNSIRPWLFRTRPIGLNKLSLLIDKDNVKETTEQIRETWKQVVPEYPLQMRGLSDVFNDVYTIWSMMNKVLAGFAGLALMLGLIGLFGMSAFIAEQRTREIGLRKVMGAGIPQIVRMMILQFSKPVLIALALAIPTVIILAGLYLDIFAERIDNVWMIVVAAGGIALALAWLTVAGHAIRVARANPIHALRTE